MAVRLFPRPSVTLPTGGATLREPYARGLVCAFAPGAGYGVTDLVSGITLALSGGAVLTTGGATAGLVCAATSACARITCPDWLKLMVPFTVVVRAGFLGTPTPDSNLFGVLYSVPESNPYVVYGVSVSAGGYLRVHYTFVGGFQQFDGGPGYQRQPVVGAPLTIAGVFPSASNVVIAFGPDEGVVSGIPASPIYSATSFLAVGDSARNANVCLEYGLIYNRRLIPSELKLFRDDPYHWLRPSAAQQFALGGLPLAGVAATIASDAPLAESMITVDVAGFVDAEILSDAPVPESIIRTSLQFLSVYAEVDLNDRASYYGGYKAPLVLQFMGARRGMSDREGRLEHLQFGATLSDTSGQFRGLLASAQNKYLLNRPLTQRVITDAARRLEEEAWIVANGFVTDYAPVARRQFKIIGSDWLKRKFARTSSAGGSAWQPRVRADDFPNANNSYQQNIGRLIPIIYGRITDTQLYGPSPTNDYGDGQLIPIYAGDTVLLGQTWAIGIIAAHHCDYLEAGFLNPGAEFGVDLDTDPDWLTPRSADWAAAGFTRPYQTINGRDYFVIYLKGDAGTLLRTNTDIADPHMAVNVWGRTDTGDETGTLLTNGFDIYEDFLRNYLCPDTPWVSGPPLPMPLFPPSVGVLPYVDPESFEACRIAAADRLAGGYQLDLALGAMNTEWSLQDVIAEFNKCLDCEAYINHYGAYAITMEPPDASAAVAEPLTDVLDIVADGLVITDRMRDFWNVLPFRHTFDYCGRMQRERSSQWRSEMSGDLDRRHELSIVRYEQERISQVYEFHFIRGKNRSTDSDYYVQGTATADDIATRLVNRYANPRRAVQITTALNGLNYDIGDIVPVSAQDGIGVNGWTDRHIRITGHEVLASTGQVILDGYDFDAVLEAAEEDLEE